MKIKSKLMLALLAVALAPIGIGSIFSYYYAKGALTGSAVNHLKSVSSVQHARIHAIHSRNLERLSLVASRTQLRKSLAAVLDKNSRQDLQKMDQILADALASIDDFVGITVYSPAGVVVAATDAALVGKRHFDPAFFDRCRTEQRVDYLFRDRQGNLRLYLSGPLSLEKRLVGVIVIESRVDSILALVRDYSGLGQTGETLVVKRDEAGNPVFLLPTRFGGDAAVGRALSRDKRYAANYSFAGEKVLLDCIDYREQPVLAIGRHVEAAGWGVVVKIDQAEAYASVHSLRRVLLLMAVAAVVLVFFVALRVSAGISAPIDNLATVAKRIADGDLSHKAEASSDDEVGALARSFNKMVDGLLQPSVDLAKKVEELRGEVAAHERSEHDKEVLIEELQKALAEIKTLKGIVPICASCKKIRDDQGFWNQIEAYVREHSEAEFSHGLCPDCARTLYPDINFPDDLR